MNRKLYSLIVVAFVLAGGASAQQRFEVDVVKRFRSDFGLSYNFFAGDNEDWGTSIRGFGSGFLLDAFTGRYSLDILYFGYDNVHLTIGAGVAITKYRMSDPIVLFQEDGAWNWKIDDNPDHGYGNGFFNNDKSKFVLSTAIFPAYLNFDLGKWYWSVGGTLDVYMTGKHKLKYTQDGDREKEVMKNQEFKDLPINKLKWSVGTMFMHEPSGFSIGVTYMLTPMWETDSNFPELNEVRISASYNLGRLRRTVGRKMDWDWDDDWDDWD